jgi:prolyl-tRNA synthetase
LWQEGHTAHATAADAAEYARRISLDVYRDFLVNVMAIPVFVGVKTATERFAGAVNSMTCEGIMRDGKALQLATSHELGQNFARVFDITYADASGAAQHAWTTSWGSSSRIVGGLIMAHGDARGLCVPPNIAPIQAVVIAVRDEGEVVEAARRLTRELSAAGVRARVDADVGTGLGRRITDWELKGVPARLELGPRDLIEGTVTVVRRDTGAKAAAPLDGAVADVAALLRQVQDGLLAQATRRRDAATVVAASAQEAAAAGQSGVARIGWERLGEHGEQRLLARGVSVRCLLRADGTIPDGDDPAGLDAIVARAY